MLNYKQVVRQVPRFCLVDDRWKKLVWRIHAIILTGYNLSIRRRTCHGVTLSETNPTWTDLRLKPSIHDKTPSTNSMPRRSKCNRPSHKLQMYKGAMCCVSMKSIQRCGFAVAYATSLESGDPVFMQIWQNLFLYFISEISCKNWGLTSNSFKINILRSLT